MAGRPPKNTGQIAEWLVWANLLTHSRSTVHMFLPLDDRGVDGILRRPADDVMVPLQVKSRTRSLVRSELEVQIPDWSLKDGSIRWILVVLERDAAALGPVALLLDTDTILRFSVPYSLRHGTPGRLITCPMPIPAENRWAPYACATDELAERILPPLAAAPEVFEEEGEEPVTQGPQHWMGALAEAEVMRLLSGVPELNVFKSFPDIELSEYIARRSPDGAMQGIQVKCVGLDGPHDHGGFLIHARNLATPTRALIAVLAWRHDLDRFDDRALLFPAGRMKELGHRSEDTWMGSFSPDPTHPNRFADVTVHREDIGRLVCDRVGHVL